MENKNFSDKGNNAFTELRKQVTLLVSRMEQKKQMDEENQIIFTALIKTFTMILKEEYQHNKKIENLEKKIEQLEEELEMK